MGGGGNDFDQEFNQKLSIAMSVVSGISMFCCIFTVALIRFRKKIFKKNLCKFIMLILTNEFFNSIGTAMGQSTNGTFDCYLQSFLTTYFCYSQSMWLSLTAWMLHKIIMHSKPTNLLSFRSFLLCCGFPLVMTLLPLSTNTYGNEDDKSGWCFLKNRKNSPTWAITFWTVVHYVIIYLNIFAYIWVLMVARKRLTRSQESLGTSPRGSALSSILSLLQQLVWYPIIMFFVYLPESLYDLLASAGGSELTNDATFLYISHLAPITAGIFMSITFILTNPDANAEVRLLLGLPPADSDAAPLNSTDSNCSSSSLSKSAVGMAQLSQNNSDDKTPAHNSPDV